MDNTQLLSFVQRIERLEEEKTNLSADIKEVYSELHGAGFDKAIVRKVVALRKMDKSDLAEQDAILDLYRRELGV